jgi:small subunit ribosomal protein S2
VVAVVDTNCDPSEVNYVIPGNDDALRAIRLFASKIADSVAEGKLMMGDKQLADAAVAADQQTGAAEGGDDRVNVLPPAGEYDEEGNDISMEDVLGGGVKKRPEAASDSTTTEAVAEHQSI